MYFTAVSGLSLGLLSPLNGLFQAEVYGDARLGTLSGVGVVVASVAAALGAGLAGVSVDVTGSYHVSLGSAAFLQFLALAALAWQAKAPFRRPGVGAPVVEAVP
jgi:hypothetical protein